VTTHAQDQHPDFEALVESWDLALRADGYSDNTLRSYRRALRSFAEWLAVDHRDVGVPDVRRDHVRGWVVHVRDTTSSGTARSHFAGVRHFFRWCVDEAETELDPTEGIKTPRPNDPTTPVLDVDEIRKLLATCTGNDFIDRRDAAIILVFLDCGLRLAELGGLQVEGVDLRERVLLVEGKGSNRSGPRRRAVPFGVKCGRALDRYLRERRKHPFAGQPQLWLGSRNRATLTASGVDRMLERRAAVAGIKFHVHMLRHTWASASRSAGLSEGDLMTLGGWRSRAMLDRYGKVAAGDRAREAYRRLSFGDRL
jgi:site-specific recombinase XerD